MNANIARHLDGMAAAQPGAAALKVPRGRTSSGQIDYLTLDFAALRAEADAWCRKLRTAGVGRGDRVLVMVRPGLPLIACVFALFKLGAVPVVIDPGMGLGHFLACVSRSRPRVLVGIPMARLLARLFRRAFQSVQVRIAASGSLTARIAGSPADRAQPGHAPSEGGGSSPGIAVLDREGPRGPLTAVPSFLAEAAPDELAAILFTSGSTGAPKGVRYEHGQFEAQVRLIRSAYAIEPGEVDLPLLPIFALFNPALGMTSVIPELDPRRPSALNPAHIVQAIHQESVTNSFGSPTLWLKIAAHCRERGLALPTLRRVLCAGAPVPAALWESAKAVLPNGRLLSPYGATEALPLATLASGEADTASLAGACVGRAVPEITLRIIAVSDEPIADPALAAALPAGRIGEIIAAGPVVTRAYDGLPDATAAAKIADPDAPGGFWHRMGDCGFLDAGDRLWFCGRKAERVVLPGGTLHTEPCERVFSRHPGVGRCALIGLRAADGASVEPALVVEGRPPGAAAAAALVRGLRALGAAHPHTAEIRTFLFHPGFPVDVRHNAKIHRLALARWAVRARKHRVA